MLTRSVVLIGLTGSGKTTAGRRLAKQLDCAFVDTDGVVSDATGLSVREIFEQRGESAFRLYETQALKLILADVTPKVVAVAGGAVMAQENRDVIRDSKSYVVWLDAEPLTLLKRVSVGSHRPLLDDDPSATLVAMSIERNNLYADIADMRVDTNRRNLKQVVKQVVKVVLEEASEQGAP